MKEKMLSKLEKDRALGQVTGLQNTLKNIETLKVRLGIENVLRVLYETHNSISFSSCNRMLNTMD